MNYRRGIVSLLTCVTAVMGFVLFQNVDWDSYGPATLPLKEPSSENQDVVIQEVHFGGKRVDHELQEFTWSQTIPMKMLAKAPVGKFRSKDPSGVMRTSQDWFARRPNTKQLPLLSFRVQAVRRSSLGDGAVVVWQSNVSARPNQHGEIDCGNRFWIPNVPGTYSIRVYACQFRRTSSGTPEFTESFVRSFPLAVAPPSKTAE
jgi:hypothetical protein